MWSNLFPKEPESARKSKSSVIAARVCKWSNSHGPDCWIPTFQASLEWVKVECCSPPSSVHAHTIYDNVTLKLSSVHSPIKHIYCIFHVSASALRDTDDYGAD